jgi:hypothetical protein
MKAEETTDTLGKFFNDLIGAWVSGAVFATVMAVMHLGPLQTRWRWKSDSRRLWARESFI